MPRANSSVIRNKEEDACCHPSFRLSRKAAIRKMGMPAIRLSASRPKQKRTNLPSCPINSGSDLEEEDCGLQVPYFSGWLKLSPIPGRGPLVVLGAGVEVMKVGLLPAFF